MSDNTKKYLSKRISDIETELSLSGPQENLIQEKCSHLKVLKMIKFIEENDIDCTKRVITLPFIDGHGGGYYGFRLMIDNEVEDIDKWTLVEDIDGKPAEFIVGDKIITS